MHVCTHARTQAKEKNNNQIYTLFTDQSTTQQNRKSNIEHIDVYQHTRYYCWANTTIDHLHKDHGVLRVAE